MSAIAAGDAKTALTVRLKDGRTLGYAEYGDPNGRPLLLFHGFPGSRLTGALADKASSRQGVRVLAIDRPGYGLSDFKKGRRFIDWPEDVLEFAALQGLERFGVSGVSGGGPYAAVCAYAIPQRLTSATIISGVGPFDAPGAREGMSTQNKLLFGLGRWAPWAGALMISVMARTAKNASDKMMERMTASLPAADKAVLAQPEVRAAFAADLRESFRQGGRGAAHELRLYARPWGFRLREIAMPVSLWQGTADKNVPVSMGRYQASVIPRCDARFIEGEGHLMCVTHMDEIMAGAV